MPKRDSPASVTIFSYQVGFGDCFLLRFSYPARARHVLIDFGTTGLPADAAGNRLLDIARDIAGKCNGRLDAVVATHRHADHISGFATRSDGKGPGDVIRSLDPRVVVQPWTEQPDAGRAALQPKLGSPQALRAQANALTNMRKVSEQVVRLLDSRPTAFAPKLAAQLRFIGEDNLANISAVRNLAAMAPRQVYTYHGGPSGLGAILPGVKTHVLGPPTLRQSEAIRRQRARDPDEFWQLQLHRLSEDRGGPGGTDVLFPRFVAHRGGKLPMSARWLAYRLRDMLGEQMLQLVRALDRQINNTSLILLFETAGKKLLFPGDAQIENWQFALANAKYRTLLADVDLYKVGHHGSLNATPRSMWDQFRKKGSSTKRGRLKTVLSTRPGKHGNVETRTEVPRATLLAELQAHSELHSTHTLASNRLYQEIHIDF